MDQSRGYEQGDLNRKERELVKLPVVVAYKEKGLS